MLERAKELWKLQSQARRIQKELKNTQIKSEAAGGQVIVIFNGAQELEDVQIADELFSPENKRKVESALKDAITEAIKQSQKIAAGKMKEISGGLGIPGL